MSAEKLIVLAGGGSYPRLVVEGAKKAGLKKVDVLAVRGATERATMRAADFVHTEGVGHALKAVDWICAHNYDAVILAGQINPLALFRTTFDDATRKLLSSLKVKCAHSIYGTLVNEFEKRGVRVLPASCYMDGNLPGAGTLTERTFSESESGDVERGMTVMRDMGRHDVGQTVLVKDGMVLAVEAFEGTDKAIKRGGRLGGKHSVLVKGAREGHDMRFDIPVVGLKTLKVMKSAGVSALAFQAGRLILLDREAVIAYANRHQIAMAGIECSLPPAPLRP